MDTNECDNKLEKWLKEIRKGTFELYILTLLNRQPMYGAKLSKLLYELTEGNIELKAGTMYPILKRLEDGGWIQGQLVESQDGEKGPGRKIYKITNPGQELSNKMVSKWVKTLNSLFKMIFSKFNSFDAIMDEINELKKYIDI